MKYDVIISIVTYNNEEIIVDTIRSILEHTDNIDYKVVVYDNNSTDGTVNTIKALNNDRVAIVESSDNKGFGYGHNQVIAAYDAKYYVIYNPDVFLNDNIIKYMSDFLEERSDVGLLSPKVKYQNGEIQYLCKQNPTVFDLFFRRFIPDKLKFLFKKRSDKYEMRETGYNKEFIVPYATGCFMFFRASVLKEIKGFDDNIFMYLEDADITRRVNEISKCVFYPYSTIYHLWGKGSHKSWKLTLINIQSAIYYFNKWGWKFV